MSVILYYILSILRGGETLLFKIIKNPTRPDNSLRLKKHDSIFDANRLIIHRKPVLKPCNFENCNYENAPQVSHNVKTRKKTREISI